MVSLLLRPQIFGQQAKDFTADLKAGMDMECASLQGCSVSCLRQGQGKGGTPSAVGHGAPCGISKPPQDQAQANVAGTPFASHSRKQVQAAGT